MGAYSFIWSKDKVANFPKPTNRVKPLLNTRKKAGGEKLDRLVYRILYFKLSSIFSPT